MQLTNKKKLSTDLKQDYESILVLVFTLAPPKENSCTIVVHVQFNHPIFSQEIYFDYVLLLLLLLLLLVQSVEN